MDTRFRKLRGLVPDARLQLGGAGTRVVFGRHPARLPEGSPPSPGALRRRRELRDALSSDNLTALADLANAVEFRRHLLAPVLDTCCRRIAWARTLLHIARRLAPWPWPVVAPSAAWTRALAALKQAEAELLALHEEAAVDLHFALGEKVRAEYWAMVEAFRALARTGRIWHASSTTDLEGLAPSPVNQAPGPRPTWFAVRAVPGLRCALPALCFGRANGAELFMMPGFLALRRPGRSLALIDLAELAITVAPVPAGGAAGKVEARGEIVFESGSGFHERFLVADWPALHTFAHRLEIFQASVAQERHKTAGETAAFLEIEMPGLTPPALPALPRGLPLELRWRAPQWELPALRVPAWRMPALRVPAWRMPAWRMPAWRMPAWRMPRWQISSVQFPSVHLPRWNLRTGLMLRWRVPRWQVPRIAMPRLQRPHWPLPSWPLPSWPLARWPRPRLALPHWHLPALTLPRLEWPRRSWHPGPEAAIQAAMATAAFCCGIVTAALVLHMGMSDLSPDSAAAPEQAEAKPVNGAEAAATAVAALATPTGPLPASAALDPAPVALPAAYTQPRSGAAPRPVLDLAERRLHPPMLSPGAQPLSTEEVEALQAKLRALQYYSGSVNGTLTERTVKAFNGWRGETDRPKGPNIDRDDYRAFLVAISR